MIQLLARLFIRNNEDVGDPGVRRAYGVLCGVVGIFLNAVLFGAKWLAGAITGSIAIMADAFNNLSDAGSSLITLIGFKLSGKRDDAEHPFGHGRAEYVAGLIVSLIIIIMGLNLGQSSVEKIFHPEPAQFDGLSLGILTLSILVKLYMAFYNRSVGRKINSAAMAATALDSLSDVGATSAVLLSALAGRFFGVNIDAWAGLLVCGLILRAGYCAARDTISPLLGNPPDPEFVRRVEQIVMGYDLITGIHDLVVHDYGPGRIMISLHAEVPGNGDLMALHEVIDDAEHRLSSELGCQAVIHMDPVAVDDENVSLTRRQVLEAIRAGVDDHITIHDFRMTPGNSRVNVIFDAVVPFADSRSDAELRAAIEKAVRAADERFHAVVTIDRPYASM